MEKFTTTQGNMEIFTREVDSEGFTDITVEDIVAIKGENRYSKFIPGSVRFSAIKNGKDPKVKIEKAIERREPLYWFNSSPSIISDTYSSIKAIHAEIGMKINFEGKKFIIEPDFNHNVRLKEV